MSQPPAVLLDLDGTLVDSVFFHVVAWHDVLREAGHDVAMWKIHAGIGMGSDRLLPWLLGAHVDDAGDLSDAHSQRFLKRLDRMRPTRGAAALVDDLEQREVPFVVSTSAEADIREGLLEVLGRPDLETTDADDVASSKPSPQLLRESSEELGQEPSRATLVGDSPWDAEAAGRIGMRTIAVRCGGFGDDALRAAGAYQIVDAPRDLVGRL